MRVFKLTGLTGKIERILDSLEKGQIYFAPPASLNDPFEYNSRVDFSSKTLSEKVEFWAMGQDFAFLENVTPSEQQRYIDDLEEQLISLSEILYKNGTQGVFCTCETWNNQVLWSHYAENHQGIAIEFDTEEAEILNKPHPVTYTDTVAVTQFYDPIHISVVEKICSQKYLDWSYEREIRFFCKSGVHTVPLTAIKSVTFGRGCRKTKWAEFKQVYQAVQSKLPHADIYEIVLDRSTYTLNRKLLDKKLPIL